MKRLSTIFGSALALWATLASIAAAATLGLTTTGLAAGTATVSSCGASSLSAVRNVGSGGTVTQVVVSGIPQSCSGQTLSITLRDQTGGSLGSASTVIGACTGGCSATFSSFGGVSAAALYGYAFALSS